MILSLFLGNCARDPPVIGQLIFKPDGWQVLAEWIDANLHYSSAWSFPIYWASNIQWHDNPVRRIDSYAKSKGRWKKLCYRIDCKL